MTGRIDVKRGKTECINCALRSRDCFREFTPKELDFVSTFKTGELAVDRGATILVEGAHSAHLFTVLDGVAFRHKILADGRRQILNYVVPGDLIGLQGSLMGEMQHTVEALTDVRLCVFERSRIPSLFSSHPNLAYDITWIAAQEERILDEHLLSVGRRTALERAAYLLVFLDHRGRQTGMAERANEFRIPVTQQHFADTLGLSLVHTNKTLRKLARRQLIRWTDQGCIVTDRDSLETIAGWTPEDTRQRPFV
ncbi:hypothetical protein CSC94_02855 [Zhengella mangrovi]|uniref:HTH crp-type domain-containing protein n=1 Tax=Zhengella mangrovi TaxID=1982044 RepID=A0A2G1QTW9_9HYPH|nr:Crp/Fnr family transcriptional regulator [Zhengella mangrovi]PHP68942.1 hypothetical protein CSC94_02855 [Zhengella mangrovi]